MRGLNEYNKCVDTSDYYREYIDNGNHRGKCFGASLYWATEVLREIANDKKTIKFAIENTLRFFDFSSHLQAVFESIFDKHKNGSYQLIVNTLNHQEDFLSKTKKTNYKLQYKYISKENTKRYIDLILKGSPVYKNKVILLVTALDEPVIIKNGYKHENNYFSHATAVLNYEGNIFFFNINSGIYRVDLSHSLTCEKLIKSIYESFNLYGQKNGKYNIRCHGNMLIDFKTTGLINKSIKTSNYQEYIG
ncbi:hypothetical protein [Yersinia enterocolitica]|uniref:hypothetical protein n=1 Tax=Yersinia enterocolitica TaxID=630 RepID=UPI003CFEF173